MEVPEITPEDRDCKAGFRPLRSSKNMVYGVRLAFCTWQWVSRKDPQSSAELLADPGLCGVKLEFPTFLGTDS